MSETQFVSPERPDNVVSLPSDRREERKQAVGNFVRDHPGLTVAGGIVVGMLVGALMPRRPARKLARRTAELAEIVSAAGVLLARQAMERAETTGAGLRHRGEKLFDKAGTLSDTAAHRLGTMGHVAAERIGELGETAADRIGTKGHVAADRISRLLGPAETAVEEAGKRIAQRASELKAKMRK